MPAAVTLAACGGEGPLAPPPPDPGEPPSGLGLVSLLSETASCPGSADACLQVDVSCSALVQSETARLKVREPGGEARGTVLFMTGGGGTGFWGGFGTDAERVLDELRSAGFRTVEIAWSRGWLDGAPGALEGQAALACKPATLAQWIHDRYQADKPDCAFCATGNSGGSAQVSYMLSHYELDGSLDLVIPTGGPPMGRIDLGCIRDDQANAPLWYPPGTRATIDRGFGFFGGGGPCTTGDGTFRDAFEAASVVSPDGDYLHPGTRVHFLVGALDESNAVPQGLAYHDRLLAAGTPFLGLQTLPGVPHAVPSARLGAERVRDLILTECRVRP